MNNILLQQNEINKHSEENGSAHRKQGNKS
jgi:hypothetical protein